MHASLSQSLTTLRARYTAANAGNSFIAPTYISSTLFSLYCIYRIITTVIAHLPSFYSIFSSSTTTTTTPITADRQNQSYTPKTDPITTILAYLTHYYDPDLDTAAWSRIISFILSGVIIAGSIRSVLITMEVLGRRVFSPFLTPNLGDESSSISSIENPHLPLLLSHLTTIYILASALLLRSNLPPEIRSVLTDSLGAPALEPRFTEWWFDGVFLWSVAGSGVGFWAGRRWGWGGDCGGEGWDDEEGEEGMLGDYVQVGKRV